MAFRKDKETIKQLSKMNAEIMGSDTDPFYGAQTVVIVLADKNIPTYLYDGSLVMGNLMNAAEAIGVESCWIHRAKEEFESEEGKAVLKKWGIDGDYEGIGHCVLGYGEKAPLKPRKGIYACSPENSSFKAIFINFQILECQWLYSTELPQMRISVPKQRSQRHSQRKVYVSLM